jgi:VCBS repeat-containing protein
MTHTSTGNDLEPVSGSITADGPDSTVTIPDTELLFSADYKRTGLDLILSSTDGRRFVVHDYFKWDKHPTLVSQDGARLGGDLVEILAGPEHPGVYAQAAPTPGPTPIGKVEAITGSATAIRGGVAVQLNMGDVVFQNDTIQTGSDSSIGFALIDGTAFRMTANARMVLNELVYDPNGNSNTGLINLVQGSISFVAGQVAHTGDLKVQTPVATMGIRGTAVNVTVTLGVGNNTTSVTLSMMDNGVANIYNATGQLIGTLTNDGTSLLLRPVGINVDISHVPADTAANNALLQELGQILQNYTNNPINFQSTPQNQPDSNPRGDNSTHSQIGNTPLQQLVTQLQGQAGVTQPDIKVVDATTHSTETFTVAITTNTLIVTPPGFSGANPTATVTELAQTTGAASPDTVQGTLTLTGNPPDAAPIVTLVSAIWSGGGNIPASLVANAEAIVQTSLPTDVLLGALQATLNGNAVSIAFDLPDKDLDFLAQGETLQITYDINLHNTGGNASQTVTVTVTGTNDLPVISIGSGNSAAASVTEQANRTGQSAADPTSGTLHFVDVDLNDTHSVAVALTSSQWSAGLAIPTQTLTDIQTALTASVTAESTGTQSGTIGWNFSLPDQDFDFLAAGQTLKLTYNVTLTDSSLGASTQSVTLTVTGANDAPVIVPQHNVTEISVAQQGEYAFLPSFNAGGRYIAFDGSSELPGPNSESGTGSVFLYDRFTSTTTDVSALIGTAEQAFYTGASISGNGQYVIFQGNDENSNSSEVYLYDRIQNSVRSLAADSGAAHASFDASVIVMENGGPIQVVDNAGNKIVALSATVENNLTHIQVTDASNHVVADFAAPTLGSSGGSLWQPDVDSTGHFITFWGTSASSPGGSGELFRYDLINHVLTPIASTATGAGEEVAALNANGRYVVFESDATNVIANHTPANQENVYVYDALNHTTTLISTGLNGASANGNSYRPSISPSGNQVIFASDASNLVAGDTNGKADTFVYDLGTHTMQLVSVAGDGTSGNDDSNFGAAVGTGRIVNGVSVGNFFAFGSLASTLVANDTDGKSDIFFVDPTQGTTGVVVENSALQAGSNLLTTQGQFTFQDVDLTDTHTIHNLQSGGALTPTSVFVTDSTGNPETLPGFDPSAQFLGTLTLAVNENSTDSSNLGAVNWNFQVDNTDPRVSALAQGQVITQIYTVTLDDGHGGTTTQTIAVEIVGVNDHPAIVQSATIDQGTVTEDRVVSGTTVQIIDPPGGTLTASGVITFLDPDLIDTHGIHGVPGGQQGNLAPSSVTVTNGANGLSEPLPGFNPQNGAHLGTLALAVHEDPTDINNQGSVSWTYTLADDNATLQSLAQNQVVTQVYEVTIDDGLGGTTTQAVTITITGTNDTPTLAAVSGPTYGDTAGNDSFATATGNLVGTDVDAIHTLTYGISNGAADNTQSGFNLSQVGTYGTLYVNTTSGAYEFIPNDIAINALKATVTENFTFTVTDDQSAVSSQTFTVTLSGVNDTPVVNAVTASATDTAAQDSGTQVASGNVITDVSDSDRDTGDILSVSGVKGAGDSSELTVSGSIVAHGTYGDLTINSDGSYSYVANAAFDALTAVDQKTDVFNITVTDGTAPVDQTLTIDITGANDTPVVNAVTASAHDTAAQDSGTQVASGNVIMDVSDSDRDSGDTLSVSFVKGSADGSELMVSGSIVAHGTYGDLTINSDGSYSYVANAAFDALTASDHKTDVFDITVTDGTAPVDQTLTIDVTGANDTPVVNPATASATNTAAQESGTQVASGNVITDVSDSDRDSGDTLSVSFVKGSADGSELMVSGSIVAHGTYGDLTINSDGSYSYVANAAFDALTAGGSSDVFDITVTDGTAPVDQTLTIDITSSGADNAPTITTDYSAPSQLFQTVSDKHGDDTATAITYANGKLYLVGDAPPGSASTSEGGLVVAFDAPPLGNSDWQVKWSYGNFTGVAADSDTVYAVGYSFPTIGLTTDTVGGTEDKAIAVAFAADGTPGLGHPLSGLGISTPPADGYTTKDFFADEGVEGFNGGIATTQSDQTILYVVGHGQPTGPAAGAYIVAEYDAQGNLLASATDSTVGDTFQPIGSPTSESTSAGFSSADSVVYWNNNVWVLGTSWSAADGQTSGDNAAAIWEYSSDLSTLVKRAELPITSTVPTDDDGGEFAAGAVLDNALYVVGKQFGDEIDGGEDTLLAKVNSDGTFAWTAGFGSGGDEALTGIVAVDGRLFATGYTTNGPNGGEDAILAEIDPTNGHLINEQFFGGAGDDQANAITTDGQFLYIAGQTASGDPALGENAFVLTYAITPTVVEAGVDQDGNPTGGVPTASVTLTPSDPDSGDTVQYDFTGWTYVSGSSDSDFVYSQTGTYGTATLTVATNTLSYTLDNNLAATQALMPGERETDAFDVIVKDSQGVASAPDQVVFNVIGAPQTAGGGGNGGGTTSIDADSNNIGAVRADSDHYELNGGFEKGNFVGWSVTASDNTTSVRDDAKHSGDFGAHIDTTQGPVVLSQGIGSGPSDTLDFWLEGGPLGASLPSGIIVSWDSVDISNEIQPVANDGVSFTEYRVVDLSPASGGAPLQFTFQQGSGSYDLDDVAFTSSAGPALLTDLGDIFFTDTNAADVHTATFLKDGSNTTDYGTFTVDTNATEANGSGFVQWTFQVDNSVLQAHLAVNQSVTQLYDVAIDDGHGGTATEIVSITLSGPTNQPLVLNSATLTVAQGGTTTLNNSDFSITDQNPNITNFLYTVNNVSGGEFEVFNGTNWVSAPTGGFTTAQIAAGQVQFVDFGSATAPSFTISVSDFANVSGFISPTMNFVTPVSQSVTDTASQDAGLVKASGNVITAGQQLTVATVQGATDGSAFTVAASGQTVAHGTYGTLSIGADGSYSYTANAALDQLPAGQNPSDVFNFTVSDGHGESANNTLTFNITGGDDAPTIAGDLSFDLGDDIVIPLTTAVLQAVDTDDAAANLTFHVVGPVIGGSLAFDYSAGSGTITSFTEADLENNHVVFVRPSQSSVAQFQVYATDAEGAQSATVTVQATEVTVTILTPNGAFALNDDPMAEMGLGVIQPGATTSHFTIVNSISGATTQGDREFVFDAAAGSSFSYDSNGLPIAGNIGAIHEFVNSTQTAIADFTALNVSAADWYAAVVADANGDPTLLNALTASWSYNFVGNSGPDTFDSGDQSDAFLGKGGNDVLIGDGGRDRAFYTDLTLANDTSVTAPINVELAAGTVTGGTSANDQDTLQSIEMIVGTNFADTYDATGFGPNSVNAGSPQGANTGTFNEFEGLGGNDTIIGNNDTRISYAHASQWVSSGITAPNGMTVDGVVVNIGDTSGASGNPLAFGVQPGTATGDPTSVGTDTFSAVDRIRGSAFDDWLVGSDNPSGTTEFFDGRGGNNYIDGRGGFDRVDYSLSTAAIAVSLAAGTVTVGAGPTATTDTLRSIEGIFGSEFSDTYDATGFTASSTNAGSSGTDSLGNAFNAFEGFGGNDTITGNGDTRIEYSNTTGQVFVTLGGADGSATGTGIAVGNGSVGTDTILGGVNAVRGGNFDDTITGDNANNTLEGGAGSDTLSGRGGNDTLYGATSTTTDDARDTLDGGAGTDTANYSPYTTNLTVHFADTPLIIVHGSGSTDATSDVLVNIENFVGGSGDDIIDGSGTITAHAFSGGGGADTITGGSGNDTIFAATSTTTDDARDILDGGAGTDTANYSPYTTNLTVHFADTPLIIVHGSGSTDATSDVLVNIENFVGGSGADIIDGSGTSTAHTFSGGGGADTITGGSANDTIFGATSTTSDDARDVIDGGGGNNTVSYAGYTTGLTVTLSTSTITPVVVGGSGDSPSNSDTIINIQNFTGGSGNDSITGDSVANVLSGGGGADTITGGSANDTIFGATSTTSDDARDVIDGGGGTNTVSYAGYTTGLTVTLSTSTAVVVGGSGDSTLNSDTIVNIQNFIGGSGNDSITGDNVANILTGGGGADTLDGKDGSDTYIFNPGDVAAGESITDTGTTGIDTIQIASGTVDFTAAAAISGIEALAFTGTQTETATFNASQLPAILAVMGTTAAAQFINVNNVSSYDASGWTFTNWTSNPDRVTFTGTSGNDVITGTNQLNFFVGSGGTYDGTTGGDTFHGGTGQDEAVYTLFPGGITVDMGQGTVAYSDGNGHTLTDTLTSVEYIKGTSGDDIYNATDYGPAGAPNHSTFAGGTFNVFEGNGGNDTITGNGNTQLLFSDATAGVTVDLGHNTATISNLAGTETIVSGVSNVFGSNFDDHITGSSGNDVLTGSGGNDTIDGGAGTDFATYSQAFAGYTVTNLGGGQTQVSGPDGTDTLTNIELMQFSDKNVLVNSGTTDVSGVFFSNSILGTSGDDTLIVGTSANSHPIDLGGGNNTVSLGQTGLGSPDFQLNLTNVETVNSVAAGANEMVTLQAAANGLNVDLGDGTDTLNLGIFTNSLTVSNVETIMGNAGNDTVTLGSAANGNTVDLGGGTDTLNLGNFTNSLNVSNAETINGGTGDDSVTLVSATSAVTVDLGGGTNALTLTGSIPSGITAKNAETITGTANSDTITINNDAGATTAITAGGGADNLTAGAGNDQFHFAAVSDSSVAGSDQITNFDAAHDTFEFNLPANSFASASITFEGTSPLAGGGQSSAHLTVDGPNTTLQIDVNGDGVIDTHDIQVVLTNLQGQLQASNFIIH